VGNKKLPPKIEFLITTRGSEFWDSHEPSRTVQVRFADDKVSSLRELHPDRPLALLRLEPQLMGKIYPTHNEDRILVRLDEVPPALIDALIAMEDRRFFEHWGISPRGLARAVVANIKAGKRVQGGSTLTQQLVKNFYLSSERSFKRKFNEAIMALLLDWHYSKEEILEVYMNEVFLGQAGKRAIHGMGQAASFYFNRPLEELELPHFALLVTLVRGASFYNPLRHPKRAKARRDLVLDVMAKQGKITLAEAKRAKEIEKLGVSKTKRKSAFQYPAFLKLVRRQLHQDYEEKDLHSEGLQIFTTLDPVIQKAAEVAMVKRLEKLEKKSEKVSDLQGAMIVTSSQYGEVLAMVNGKATHSFGFNRPLNAERQIGSLIKPAVYLAALEQGYTLISLIDDTPYKLITQSGQIWKPKNYGGRVHGQVPLYHALAHSYNLATVRLGMEGLGLDKVADTLKRLGIERKFQMYPADLLGSIALTPLEVIQMYQTIASKGFSTPLRAIRDVLDRDGKALKRYSLSVKQTFEAGPIFLLNYALQRAVREGTGRYVARTLPKKSVLAGKTGTTNNSRDSWFAGFGSDLVTVIWVGRDDNKPMSLTGASGAMLIWRDFIKAVRPQSLPPVTPKGVQWRWVDGKKRRCMPFVVDQNRGGGVPAESCEGSF
jgi:penicillin-binding protein 1B